MRNTFLDKKDNKNSLLKKKILGLCIGSGEYSIAELSSELNASVPTVTKLLSELIDDGFITDLGKLGTSGGRRPSIYGLNPAAGYFVGADVGASAIDLAITDFKGDLLVFKEGIPFKMEADEVSVHKLSHLIRTTFDSLGRDWSRVLGCGVSFTGRVNPETGYSFSYSFSNDSPIDRLLSDDLGVKVTIENDSRAMTFGEYLSGVVKKERNVLFVNVNLGLGMGLVLDGKLFYGKSGFSGEIGHIPFFDNEVICRCGKKGCLETEASGLAFKRKFEQRLRDGRSSALSARVPSASGLSLEDILEVIKEEDVLAIEVLEEIGAALGRGLAGIINIVNPELVVIGGRLAVGGDYLMLPIRSNVRKYAQNIVSQDTAIKFSKLGRKAAATGDCLLSRSKLLGVL